MNAGQTAQKLNRIKTSILLFEIVPAEEEKYALLCVIETSATAVADTTRLLGTCYENLEGGPNGCGIFRCWITGDPVPTG